MAEHWFNTNYHTTTKLTPFEALYGFQPPKILNYIPGLTKAAVVEEYLQNRQQILSLLKTNLVAAQDIMKLQADKHRVDKHFEVGDWVFQRLQPFKHSIKEGWEIGTKVLWTFPSFAEDWPCCL